MSVIESFVDTLSSPHTRRAYRTDLRHFFADHSRQIADIQDLQPGDISHFVESLQEDGLSVATQRRRLSALRRLFDWLVESGKMDHNPARAHAIAIGENDAEATDPRVLNKDELEQLVRAAGSPDHSGPRDRALVLTILFGALRRRDVAGLTVDEVRPLGRHWILDLGGRGYVRIPAVVVDALEAMKATYDIESGPLWRSLSNRNLGRPLSADAIYRTIRRIGERADLGSIDIDTLRRSGLRLALDGGADLNQIQTHGRLKALRSAVAYVDSDRSAGPLQESAADWIDLDVEGSDV